MLTFYVQSPDHSEVSPCNTGEHIVFRTQTISPYDPEKHIVYLGPRSQWSLPTWQRRDSYKNISDLLCISFWIIIIFCVFKNLLFLYIPTFNYGAPQKTVTHSLRNWGLMDYRKINMGHCKYGWTMNNCDLHRSLSFCWGKSTEQLLCVFQGFTLSLDFLSPNWPDMSPG